MRDLPKSSQTDTISFCKAMATALQVCDGMIVDNLA